MPERADPATPTTPPDRRQRPLAFRLSPEGVAKVVVVAVLTALDWPVPSISPAATGRLDGSWQYSLHVWGASLPGLGPHIEFTYGPLGFLTLPTLWTTRTGVLAWCVVLAITLGCSAVAVVRLRRWLPWWATVALALLAVRGIMLLDGAVAAVPVFATWWAVGRPSVDARGRLLGSAALGVLASAVLLCKFGDGLVLVGVALAAPFLWHDKPWRELAGAVGGVVLGLTVLWTVVTAAPGALWAYLRSSVTLADGYSAMAVSLGDSVVNYVVAALLVSILLLLSARVGDSRTRTAGLALTVLWVVALEFKHAFVRADSAHLPTFYAVTCVLALACGVAAGPPARRALAVLAAALSVVFAVRTAGPRADAYTSVAAAPTSFGSQILTLPDTGRRNRVEHDAAAQMRGDAEVPPQMLRAIGTSGVQIDPYEMRLAWAYHLSLRPVPVMQTYSAYTPALDRADAAAVGGPSAPPFILRDLHARPVDGRVAAWEGPAYQLAELCDYRQRMRIGRWQLLQHSTDRCGRPQRLSVASLAGTVDVPDAPPGTVVAATIELRSGAWSRLSAWLFRGAPLNVVVDGRAHRFVAGTAGELHLLSVPPHAPVGPQGNQRMAIGTLAFPRSTDGTITFFAIPYAAAT